MLRKWSLLSTQTRKERLTPGDTHTKHSLVRGHAEATQHSALPLSVKYLLGHNPRNMYDRTSSTGLSNILNITQIKPCTAPAYTYEYIYFLKR